MPGRSSTSLTRPSPHRRPLPVRQSAFTLLRRCVSLLDRHDQQCGAEELCPHGSWRADINVYGRSHGEPLTVSVVDAWGTPVSVSGVNSAVDFNVTAQIPATNDYFVTFTPVTQPESPSLAFDVTFYIP